MQLIDNIKAAVQRVIGQRPWLDHLVRAAGRYQSQRGDYYAAGITYFTVLSLFPLLMVAFAVAGFVLAGNAGTARRTAGEDRREHPRRDG